ncbi:MAG: thioredoxin family protein [Luteolibacter sp.]
MKASFFEGKFPLKLQAMALLAVLSGLMGCDKVTTLVGNLKKTPAAKESPRVAASFSREQISTVTSAGHAAFISRPNALVVVDFYADWCGPCKMLSPVLEKAAESHPGVVFIGKVNVDQASDLAAAQGVRGIPDVRIYQNGREVERFVGFPGEPQVLERIAKLSAGITPVAAAAPGVKTPSGPVIQPLEKDWMPPGMKRQNSTSP